MQANLDEADSLQQEEMWKSQDEGKEVIKAVKARLFSVFFRINSVKVAVPKHYYVVLVAVESFHLLSIVFNDGKYSALGPFAASSPWNLSQTQWLIDICWAFRVDRFLRTSLSHFVALLSVVGAVTAATVLLCLFLSQYQQSTSLSTIACKVVRLFITLLVNVFYLPICDLLCFGISCATVASSDCLGLPQGYLPLALFSLALVGFVGLSLLSAVLYYDFCVHCGNFVAKPHPRFKVLRLVCYATLVVLYYFVDIQGRVIVFLVSALLIGSTLCYTYIRYLPYFQESVCKLRLTGAALFCSAVFCMLVGQFSESVGKTSSSVSLLCFFLTPGAIQIVYSLVSRRRIALLSLKAQHLANIYIVEIKGRILVQELENAKARSLKCSYSDTQDPEFESLQSFVLAELETLYSEAFRKFPNSGYLHLWSGLLQVHVFKNYIRAMVQCFKGLAMDNKIDSEYALSYFRRTSEVFYKANMRDDAYEFVQFEKCSAVARADDEVVTRAQLHFWAELESPMPQVPKLLKLASEITVLVARTKSDYEKLLKLNAKSTKVLKMFGNFLMSLNGYSDLGTRYIQKAESQENPDNAGTFLPASVTRALSFFDFENAILSVSADIETIGEIHKVASSAPALFEYPEAEFVGRNISILIPEPFSSLHDAGMKQFHESSSYVMVDQPALTLFFVNKRGLLLKCRTLIKVVPNGVSPPFFLAAIRPTKPTEDMAMATTDLGITAFSQGFSQVFELTGAKAVDQHVESLIPGFAVIREKMADQWTNFRWNDETLLSAKLCKLVIGKAEALVLYARRDITNLTDDRVDSPTATPLVSPTRSNNASQVEEESASELESESESDYDSEDSSSAEESGDKEAMSPHITFPENVVAGESRSSVPGLFPAYLSPESSENSLESSGKEPVEQRSLSSKGSSLANSAQFNKAVKALINYEYSKARNCVIRFKVALFLTILVLIGTSVGTFKVIESAVGYNDELSHFVSLVGHLRLHSHSLSYYSRMLTLIDGGMLPGANRTRYEQWLAADSDEMHSINLRLYKHFKLLQHSDKTVYFREDIPVWVKAGRDTRAMRSNLFDATSNLVVQAYLLKRETRPLTMGNRRAFYLFRNGIGETLQALNASARFYVTAAQRGVSEQRGVAVALILVSAVLLACCAMLAIAPNIKSLERSKRELWELMFEVPKYVCRTMRGKCAERFKEINETVNLELEELPEKEETADDQNNDDSQREKPQNETHITLPSDPRQRNILIMKLMSFFVINLVYFYLIYYTSFEASGDVMDVEPVAIDWANRRRHLSKAVNHWVLESLLENVTGVGYKFVVSEGQTVGAPAEQALRSIAELQMVENALTFGTSDLGFTLSSVRSSAHNDLMFTNACTAPKNRSETDCETVADKSLSQGLHSAIGTYISLAKTALLKIELMTASGNYDLQRVKMALVAGEIPLLRSLDESYLYDPLSHSTDLFESDFSRSQATMSVWQHLLISIYIVSAVLFYLFVYHPMIHKVTTTQLGREARCSWNMCTLLPQEYQEEFHRLSAIIKERRDRFKWR